MTAQSLRADGTTAPARPASLWFGLLGGAVAWTIHLVGAYLVAEFGCLTRFGEQRLLGITAVAWMIAGLTVVTAVTALFATAVSYRCQRRLGAPRGKVESDAQFAMAWAGVYASGFALSVIVVETIPIFYYLKDC